MFEANGTLIYEPGYRLVVAVPDGLADFYRSLIPKSIPVQKPRWGAHITVVRSEKETPTNIEHWGKYDGEVVLFNYDTDVHVDETCCWLNVWCDRLVQIREELGLPPKSRWTLPPSGGHQCFHMTIANKKFR